jgi:hypothetical protein
MMPTGAWKVTMRAPRPSPIVIVGTAFLIYMCVCNQSKYCIEGSELDWKKWSEAQAKNRHEFRWGFYYMTLRDMVSLDNVGYVNVTADQ